MPSPKILDVDSGMDVGAISKQWMGFFTEALTDRDTFRVNFPANATLETKAILIGATMLVVSWYFFLNTSYSTLH